MRRPSVLVGVALVLVVLAGCSSVPRSRPPVQPPADPAGVVLHVGDQKGGTQSLLRAANLLGGLPYRIEWTTFSAGPPLIEAARSGAIDIGQTGNTPVIFAAAAKARVQLVAASQGNVVSDAILVPHDSPIHTVADLRGKKVAFGKGTSAHGQLLYTLRAAGLTMDDIDPSYLQPSDAYAAFKQGQVDAWATWDPYTAQAQLESGARVIATGDGTANGYSFEVASNEALADPRKQAAVADYLRRVDAAMRYSDTHRDQRAVVWSRETKLALPVTQLAAQRGPDLPVPMDDRLVASEQDLADAFSDAGVIPGRVRFADIVDRRFEGRAAPL
ncbi:ABC transporter substrate-binding protein [Actinomycetospora sp. TBRC 11914]|uniref:ABC transporter substrate-binding protein n=1 Tax=Actinomycetospora sp. TBRC 11914 TaxID=2729387 RepID=UPI00145F1E00|nr:ABC transporter substrate-binding protein [Actinomycetospora sp. TBRC 11914]NMO91471.1 ABC transporter substrate-binding protein [Actinomycetospora sp. TBRC 11914]